MGDAKSLHWSFFVRDRTAEIAFYKYILGMKVLRHYEHVEKGAHPPPRNKAMWSTTLLSYGDEYRNFSIKIIFCYDPAIGFTLGNDFTGMTIQSDKILPRAVAAKMQIADAKLGAYKAIMSPNGYRFFIIDKPEPNQDLILKIHLTCSDELNVLMFWHCILGAKYFSHYLNHSVVVGFNDYGIKIKFRKTDVPIVNTTHGCRFTCSMSLEKLKDLEQFMNDEDLEVSFPLTPLEVTEEGHSVMTMIVEDFDGHPVALCDEIEYDRQAVEDDRADQVLTMAMRKEKIYRGENPIVDKNDENFFNFIKHFEEHEKCRKRRSFRILGPLTQPAYSTRA